MLRLILISTILYCSVGKSFANERCQPPLKKNDIQDLSDQLIDTYFTQLADHREKELLEIKFFRDDEYFLKTMFKKSHFLKKKNNRKLFLYINLALLDCPPSKEALKSILVHEMFHLKDYLDSSSGQLLSLGAKYLSQKSRANYERYTDLRAMELNFAQGLIEYRDWIYPLLNKKQLKKKRILYYTPEQIRDWLFNNRS